MTARIAVLLFPGSNCEHDAVEGLRAAGGRAEIVWHGTGSLDGFDGVVVPGGFAHGDYLRPGAIARFSEVMEAVGAFAASGGPVLGICNGFQVLTESGLLPGALRRNANLRFLCRTVELEVVSSRSVLTEGVPVGSRLHIPINHYDGNFTCDAATLAELEANDQIVLRYTDNLNGSVAAIAGVSNRAGNVVGLMPHPERASDPILGSSDGLGLLASVVSAASAYASAGHGGADAPHLHDQASGDATLSATAGTVGRRHAGSGGVNE